MAGRPRPLDGHSQLVDEGSVVELPGERVAPSGLDQGDRLARDPALGGAEDQGQHDGGDERRDEGRDHDVPAQPVELGEDRDSVTPDGEDRLDAAIGLERKVLAQDAGAGERSPGSLAEIGRAERGLDGLTVDRGPKLR